MGTRNFSSSVEKVFPSERRERVKYFSTREEKFRISKRRCNFLQNPRSTKKDALFFLFQKLRFKFDNISLQSLVYLYHKQSQVLDSARKYCELIGQK